MKFATVAIIAVAQVEAWKIAAPAGNPTRQEILVANGALNTPYNAVEDYATGNDSLALSGDRNRHSHTTTTNVATPHTVDDSYNTQVGRNVVNTINDITTVRSHETVMDVRSRQVDASRVDIVPEVRTRPIQRVETYTALRPEVVKVPVTTYDYKTTISYDTKVDKRTRKVPTEVCDGEGQKYCNLWKNGWCKDWQVKPAHCRKSYVEEDYEVVTKIPVESVQKIAKVHYETEIVENPVEMTRSVRDTEFYVHNREVPHGTYRAVIDHIPREVNRFDTTLVPRAVTSVVKDTVRVPRSRDILLNEVHQSTNVHTHAGGKRYSGAGCDLTHDGRCDNADIDANGDGLVDAAGMDIDRIGSGLHSDEVVVRRAKNPSGPASGHHIQNRYARKGYGNKKW